MRNQGLREERERVSDRESGRERERGTNMQKSSIGGGGGGV